MVGKEGEQKPARRRLVRGAQDATGWKKYITHAIIIEYHTK